MTFRQVEAIGRTLPDVEVATMYGKPALKVHGRMFACMTSHPSSEPNTLVVRMDFAQRNLLVDEAPEAYYLKEHYLNYPCVLVRLSQVTPDALRDLIAGAHRFVTGGTPAKKRLAGAKRRSAGPARDGRRRRTRSPS